MNRCTILVLFDKSGVFDEYVFSLIKELRTVSRHIIIVINGMIQKKYLEKLRGRVERIMIRDNIGFDAGAYREVILDYLPTDYLQQYDEVIFCNDTFFGPFIPLKQIFREMNSKPCDYWGFVHEDCGFASNLHSYFLVFKSKIMDNREIEYFFKEVSPCKFPNFMDACMYFEIGLFRYLSKRGYQFATYVECDMFSIYPYQDRAIELCKFPLLKKKMFSKEWFNPNIHLRAIQLIAKIYNYDINEILYTLNRLYNLNITFDDIKGTQFEIQKAKSMKRFITDEKLQDFYKKIEKFYIFGNGKVEERFGDYLIRLGCMNLVKFKGYIVSDGFKDCKKYKQNKLYAFSDVKVCDNEGVIVLLSQKNSIEIKPLLSEIENCLIIYEEQ